MKPIPPFPDEFVLGHLARLVGANAVETPDMLYKTYANAQYVLRHQVRPFQYRHWRVVYYYELTQGLEMDMEEYMRKHTLQPIAKHTQTEAYATRGGFLSDAFVRYHIPLSFMADDHENPALWKFCVTCRALDRLKYGIAYWHREHQVPGVDICPHHDEALNCCGAESIFSDPTISHPDKLQVSTPAPELIAANRTPAISLYRDIFMELLKRPLSAYEMQTRFLFPIRKSRMECGLDRHTVSLPPLAAVMSRNEIPDIWIAAHLPPIKRKWAAEGVFPVGWRSELQKSCQHRHSKSRSDLWTNGLNLLLGCAINQDKSKMQRALWPENS